MIGFRETGLDELSVAHEVEVNTLTGDGRISVPIRTTAGRDGFGPSLSLGYSSGAGNSSFGMGWFLSGVPSIGLDTSDELPVYGARRRGYSYAGGQQLVPALEQQAGGQWIEVTRTDGDFDVHTFRSQTERSFERFERWTHRPSGREHWLARARNGVVSVFGLAPDDSSRIADPSDPGRRTFQWLLEAQYDPKGNAIVYEYKAEDRTGVDSSLSYETGRAQNPDPPAQRYLKRVLYGNSRPLSVTEPSHPANQWRFEVVFDFGEHGAGVTPSHAETAAWPVREDPTSTYRPGFEVRTYRLCRRILTFHHFPELEGGAATLVGATELTFDEDPAGTVLDSITYRGHRTEADGTRRHRAVPSLGFVYTQPSTDTAFTASELADNMPVGLDGASYSWMDVHNEGLPGVLSRHEDSWYFKESLGGGRFGPMSVLHEIPVAASVAFQLDDFDGDGNLDLVGFEGREAGYYARDRDSGSWQGFRSFRDLPRVDFANANVQWVDLNGDGHPDLVVERSDRLVWYASSGVDGFEAAREIPRPDTRSGGAPTLTQNHGLHTFFADMTGDGLPDMVRVDHGRVEYWPNLGYGTFGTGVVMGSPPNIESFGQYDTSRLRWVDLDGSGTADLLYIGCGEIRYWINQSGNRFSDEHRLPNLPYIDNLSSAVVLDFLGDGTRCLVWSTPVSGQEGQALKYLQLSRDLPPRLLVSVQNGMGLETRLSYRSSAAEYLRDKEGAQPWRTLLPRHKMVVTQVEGLDHVAGTRGVTRYEYRDGHFDDEDGRFVGFGRVDAFDADQIGTGGSVPADDVTAPSVVRTWYHTGAGDGFPERVGDFYARDPLAHHLPTPTIEDVGQLTTDEVVAASRTLAGALWRQEFFGSRVDGSREPHPFRTTEFAYTVRRLQPATDEDDAAYTFVQSESLSHEYEQDPSDPRVTHEVVLRTDSFGNVAERVSLAYARRPVGPEVRPEQQTLHAQLVERAHHNVSTPDRLELGVETEEHRYAVFGLAPPVGGIFDRDDLTAQVHAALANPIGFTDSPGGLLPQAQLVGRRRNRFWDDTLSDVADPGEIGAPTLLHHVERVVFPEGDDAALLDGLATTNDLTSDALYRLEDAAWWADDTTYRYRGPAEFYRLAEETSPLGGVQTFAFDPHLLLVTQMEDGFGNQVTGVPDYNVMASQLVTDANGNVSEVLYDPLGVAGVTVLRGSQLGADGNVHDVGDDDLATYTTPAGAPLLADVLADPDSFIQQATRFFSYDLEAFGRGDGPPHSVLVEREQHRHDGEGSASAASPLRITVGYIDGFGRPIQTKTRADPGPAIQRVAGSVVVDGDGDPVLADAAERWLVGGHDVYNNKGWLARTYEPFFSPSPAFESDQELRQNGVATRNRYDPIGRLIRQDLPNGTTPTVEFESWTTRESDGNDNVIGSLYEALRSGLPATDVERQALDKAIAHANTPTIIESDPLGRPFRVRELGGGGVERTMVTTYNGMGLPAAVVDARGLTAMVYRYDMLGRPVLEQSMDAGRRFRLFDTRGHPVHEWDARGVHSLRSYDINGRHVQTRVQGLDADGTALDHIVEQVIYGDDPLVAQAQLRNARGRIVERRDDAGVVAVARYHMDGQAVAAVRRLRSDYKATVDWADPGLVALDPGDHRSSARIDALGRTVEQSLPDGTTRHYDYARLGHVSEIRVTTDDSELTDQVVVSGIETNARAQRTEVRFGNGVGTTYEYDPSTFRLQRLYTRRLIGAARDYLDIAYNYDPVGNLTHLLDRVQEPAVPTPLLQGATITSASEFTYDAFYQLTSASGRVHQALLEHDYTSGLTGTNPIKGTHHLGLDNGAAVERYTRTYEYDVAGNIERTRHGGATRTWTTEMWISPTSNRSLPAKDLNGIDVVDPENHFDSAGNTIRLPHLRSMLWNPAGRLARAVVIDRSGTPDPDDAEYYVYGADGLRVRRVTEKLVGGQLEVTDTTFFEGCEIRRIVSAGVTRLHRRTSHLTDGDARVATLHHWLVDQSGLETDDVTQKKLHYLVGNHLGSVSLELDEVGDVISYEEYFPFGGTSFLAGRSARDVKLKDYRYSGKSRDDATGLYHYEYRYYAPFIGNWISPDPIGAADGLNLYRFVHNNPIRFIDANGLQTADVKWTESRTNQLPPAIQKLLEDPALQARLARGEDIYFVPDGNGGFTAGTKADLEAWGRLEAEAGRTPHLAHLDQTPAPADPGERSGAGVSDEEFEEMLRTLDEILAPIRDTAPTVESATAESSHDDDPDSRGTSAHPADGGSDKGSTKKGKTGETGSNGNATTGTGNGAGSDGKGKGGGGPNQPTTPGQGPQGSGTGAGTGTGDATGPGKGPGTGRGTGGTPGGKGDASAPGGKGTRDEGTKAGADPTGPDGKQDQDGKGGKGQSNASTTPGGVPWVPPVPPGLPISPDGVPYSPDLQVPEVLPEPGAPTPDPSASRGGDGRGAPGSDGSGGVRPGGTEGAGTAGASGGQPGGVPGGQPGGTEGGQPGGGQGLKGGRGDHELPGWLSWIDTGLDWLQTGLDVVGLIPGLGEIADGVNGLISLARGDKVGATLSFAAMVPFAGWAATAGKFGRKAVNAADALGDVTSAVAKHGDEAASVLNVASKNADEAAQFASKNADEVASAGKATDETSFEGLIDLDDFNNSPGLADRLSRAEEFDIGGYKDLTGSGRYGRVGDNLDSDEVLQNLFVRHEKGVSRTADILKENPAVALSPANHRRIRNLKTPDLAGRSAQDVLKHHLDQMADFTPHHVLVMVERESLAYIKKKLGL